MLTSESLYAAAVNLATGIAGAAAAVFALRRRFSRDSRDIAQDRTEINLMDRMMTERDTYMRLATEAQSQRVIDVGRMAHLEGTLEACDRERKALDEKIFAMRLHMRKLTSIIVRLDPQSSHMLEIDIAPGDGIDTQPQELRG